MLKEMLQLPRPLFYEVPRKWENASKTLTYANVFRQGSLHYGLAYALHYTKGPDLRYGASYHPLPAGQQTTLAPLLFRWLYEAERVSFWLGKPRCRRLNHTTTTRDRRCLKNKNINNRA